MLVVRGGIREGVDVQGVWTPPGELFYRIESETQLDLSKPISWHYVNVCYL